MIEDYQVPRAVQHRWHVRLGLYYSSDGHPWLRWQLGPLSHVHHLQVDEATMNARMAVSLSRERSVALGGERDHSTGELIEPGRYHPVGFDRLVGAGEPVIHLITYQEVSSELSAGAAWAAGGPILHERPATTEDLDRYWNETGIAGFTLTDRFGRSGTLRPAR